ncbi:MAG: hypothetical protein ACYSWW_12775 [Planctomycetota bacterium]
MATVSFEISNQIKPDLRPAEIVEHETTGDERHSDGQPSGPITPDRQDTKNQGKGEARHE